MIDFTGINFHKIAMQWEPHLDAIASAYLLMTRGESKFPGISTATIDFVRTAGVGIEGVHGDAYLLKGVVPLGLGGGMFDEHATLLEDRKQGDCALTRVARYLGVEEDPTFKKIMEYVRISDLKAQGHPFDLAAMVKAMHLAHPNDAQTVIDWTFQALHAKHFQQTAFCHAKSTVLHGTVKQEVKGPKGKPLFIFIGETDEEQYSRASRAGGAAVVIQKNGKGQVSITNNNAFCLEMRDTIQMLRVLEQEAAAKKAAAESGHEAEAKPTTSDWDTLGREGIVAGAENWYFQEEGQLILNGSRTRPDVPPTLIPLDQIQEAVAIGIDPNAFEQRRQKSCLAGRCTSTEGNPCPWYKYGLDRCRRLHRRRQ